jgi:biopolymer transport protein ExbD
MSFGGPQRDEMIAGINVTPLVDIVLVLLIVFMVTAKMVVSPAVPLDLPEAKKGEEVQTVFVVSLPKGGGLLVDGEEVPRNELLQHAKEALAQTPDLRAVMQVDGDVAHRDVIGVLDVLKDAGIAKIAFGTSWPDAPAARGEAKDGEE